MTKHMSIAHAICAAQGGKCFYCGVMLTGPQLNKKRKATQWSQDHVSPKSGGHTLARNMVLACLKCNIGKSDSPPSPDDVARAKDLHAQALVLVKAFNGEVPVEWRGEPTSIAERANRAEVDARVTGFYPELYEALTGPRGT